MKIKKRTRQAGVKTTKRLLGRILLDGGFITHEDLSRALVEQKQTRELLGEILIRMGAIKPADLSVILPVQRDLASLEGISRLVNSGHIEISGILLNVGFVTPAQLKNALKKQKETKKDAGEILIEKGHIDPHKLSYARSLQHRLTAAILAAALSFAVVTAHEVSSAKAADAGFDSGAISINARILGRAMMKVVNQAEELVITEADIGRGYVVMPSASTIDIRTNSRKGYMLTFKVLGEMQSFFKTVKVLGAGEDIEISKNGGRTVQIAQPYPGKGPETLRLGCRFLLSEDAEAGTYAWPPKITAKPIL